MKSKELKSEIYLAESANYNNILKYIYLNGKLHHDALNMKFYQKHNIMNVFEMIFNLTEFLNDSNVTLRERIFYLEKDFNSVQTCPHCKTNKLIFKSNIIGLTKTCGNKKCRSEQLTLSAPGKKAIIMKVSKCVGCFCDFSHKSSSSRKYCNNDCRYKNLKYKHSDETKRRISETNKETHNTPEFKIKKLEIYTDAHRQNQSEKMKQLIADGKFTPCITNSWNHWNATVELEDGTVKKFRSSWEACFWLHNQHLEFEKLRIPYEIDGTWKNYIVDFIDFDKKILYEIKPNSSKNNEVNVLKLNAALVWCKINDYSYVSISDEWFVENVKNVNFKNNKLIEERMRQFLVK